MPAPGVICVRDGEYRQSVLPTASQPEEQGAARGACGKVVPGMRLLAVTERVSGSESPGCDLCLGW